MYLKYKMLVLSMILIPLLLVAEAQGDESTTTTPTEDACKKLNSSCGECVSNAKCFWCTSSAEKCLAYPSSSIIPPASVCPLMDIKVITCAVNLGIVIIVCGTLAGVIVIAFTVCICCCCCRQKRGLSRRELREEQAESAETEARRTRNAERRAERQTRWNEIRQKYGLSSSSNAGGNYSRFSNEATEA